MEYGAKAIVFIGCRLFGGVLRSKRGSGRGPGGKGRHNRVRVPAQARGSRSDVPGLCFDALREDALHHRDRSGEGQYIDLSQIEAAIHFLEPLLLDYTVNGRVTGMHGLDSQRACPHGVFAARGTHRYVAVAVEGPEQWAALRGVVPGLAAIADCEPLATRLERKAELEKLLGEWCAGQEPFACAQELRESGVPAFVVMRATDLHEDSQLAQRNFFVELDHSAIGPTRYDGPVTLFSRTPAVLRYSGPPIGENTLEVLKDILGYNEDEIASLAAAGALT